MELHSETWGHVRFGHSDNAAVCLLEEAHETFMLRCRFGLSKPRARASLAGYTPQINRVIFNPNTLKAIIHIFQMDKGTLF